MTLTQIDKRLSALEDAVRDLSAGLKRPKSASAADLLRKAGWFADDPAFEKAARRGRQYRKRQQNRKIR